MLAGPLQNHLVRQFTALLSARASSKNDHVSGSILVPETLGNLRKSIKKRRPENDRKTDVDFVDLLFDLGSDMDLNIRSCGCLLRSFSVLKTTLDTEGRRERPGAHV